VKVLAVFNLDPPAGGDTTPRPVEGGNVAYFPSKMVAGGTLKEWRRGLRRTRYWMSAWYDGSSWQFENEIGQFVAVSKDAYVDIYTDFAAMKDGAAKPIGRYRLGARGGLVWSEA
jgi:hypothetical protein